MCDNLLKTTSHHLIGVGQLGGVIPLSSNQFHSFEFNARIYLNIPGIVAIMDVGYNQSLIDLLKPSEPGEDKKWYEAEPAEGHRFLGDVLQLRIRREIMKFISLGMKTKGEIERTFGLNEIVAEVHLALLEKAMMIEKVGDGYRSTPIGIAYLKNFEDFASEPSKNGIQDWADIYNGDV